MVLHFILNDEERPLWVAWLQLLDVLQRMVFVDNNQHVRCAFNLILGF